MDLSSLVIPDDITPKFDLHQVSPVSFHIT